VSDQQNVARLTCQAIANPFGWIARLQVACGGEIRERVAHSPEGFGGLLRSKLPAVPDDNRTDPSLRCLGREKIHRRPSDRRQWTLGIDFRADRIAVMNEIETHQMNDNARQAQGVRGWLLVLCLLFLVWRPFNSALVAAGGLAALSVRGPSLVVGLVALTLVTAFGIAAGIALLLRRGPAVTLATVALLLSAAIDFAIYTTSYFPSNRMPGDTPLYVAGSLAYHSLWIAYLFRSKRVRETY
jgi:hypothetical protein